MMMGFGLLGLVLIGGIALVAVLGGSGLVSRKGTGAQWLGGQSQPAARQVLDERFARGEITADEYKTIRAQLER